MASGNLLPEGVRGRARGGAPAHQFGWAGDDPDLDHVQGLARVRTVFAPSAHICALPPATDGVRRLPSRLPGSALHCHSFVVRSDTAPTGGSHQAGRYGAITLHLADQPHQVPGGVVARSYCFNSCRCRLGKGWGLFSRVVRDACKWRLSRVTAATLCHYATVLIAAYAYGLGLCGVLPL